MPIRKEFRKFYGREWRTVTRPRILTRAGDKCEQCGKPHAEKVFVLTARFEKTPLMFWRRIAGRGKWFNCYGGELPDPPARSWGTPRMIRCVVTIAHLNHIPGDDRDENLKALCQWCHLHYDKLHHRETRATRKDARRPLLQEAASRT